MYHNFKVIILCLFVAFPITLMGQGTGNSPFSQFGIGDLSNNNGNVRNMGMGYAGISAGHPYFVNLSNPALLPNKRTAKKARPNHSYKSWDFYRNQTVDSTVKLDFALTYQQRGIQSANGYDNTGGMNISYFSFAIPLSKTWSTSLGIQPYSSVNYNLTSSSTVTGDSATTVNYTTSGKGGIYKIFWSNGVGITQNLSLGLETAFLYGNINNEYFANIPSISTKSYGFKRQVSYSAMSFKPGAHFRREIIQSYTDTIFEKDSSGIPIKTLVRKTKSSGMFYNIGFTCELNSSMNVMNDLHYYVIDNSNRISNDTTIQDPGTEKSSAQIPPVFKLGFSIDVPFKWTIAADVFYSDWSVYRSSFAGDRFGSSYGINLGGEFTPGQTKLRSRTYRLGFSYLKTPVIYLGKQLDDISASIGATIPFGRRNPTSPILSRVNIAVIAGQRGSVQDFGLQEQYIKVHLGLLINEKWFNKRKIY
jgi:hypothetical protein